MKRAKKILLVAAPITLAGAVALGRTVSGAEEEGYRFAAVEQGDLLSTVAATGTLSAVRTVQVGTQVSGQVAALYADFNDEVKKGQLLARIDPTLLEQAVREAEIGVQRSRAELEQANQEYERNQQLHERSVITDAEMSSIEYKRDLALTGAQSADIALERARRNLSYTEIYAPIDGVIVERNVDVGQTVSASTSAPQLFLIANDLSAMQILASVNESDIGLIHSGQTVRFTVQAYPTETFTGSVTQVRLQSAAQENVVNYTVVVSVANPDEKLLPGMTATLDFVIASASSVLTVPNAALRYRPEGSSSQRPAGARQPDAAAGRAPSGSGPADGVAAPTERTGLDGVVWVSDAAGNPTPVRVRTGITDGQRTEVSGEGLGEGMAVIIGQATGVAAEAASNPFQSGQGQGQGRRPATF